MRKDINLFRAIGALKNGQGNITPEWKGIADTLATDEQDRIGKIDSDIGHGILPESNDIKDYNDIMRRKLMPLDYITHNAMILFVLEVFAQFAEVKKFYQSYYPLIVLDEFQDTNCIAWALLESVVSDQTQLVTANLWVHRRIARYYVDCRRKVCNDNGRVNYSGSARSKQTGKQDGRRVSFIFPKVNILIWPHFLIILPHPFFGRK